LNIQEIVIQEIEIREFEFQDIEIREIKILKFGKSNSAFRSHTEKRRVVRPFSQPTLSQAENSGANSQVEVSF